MLRRLRVCRNDFVHSDVLHVAMSERNKSVNVDCGRRAATLLLAPSAY